MLYRGNSYCFSNSVQYIFPTQKAQCLAGLAFLCLFFRLLVFSHYNIYRHKSGDNTDEGHPTQTFFMLNSESAFLNNCVWQKSPPELTFAGKIDNRIYRKSLYCTVVDFAMQVCSYSDTKKWIAHFIFLSMPTTSRP